MMSGGTFWDRLRKFPVHVPLPRKRARKLDAICARLGYSDAVSKAKRNSTAAASMCRWILAVNATTKLAGKAAAAGLPAPLASIQHKADALRKRIGALQPTGMCMAMALLHVRLGSDDG